MRYLERKTAIVTGASRGIERKIAEQLADLGAAVVINYSSNSQKAKEVVEFLVSEKAKWITGQTIRINGGFI